ncbi:hypothetical protein DBV15_07947 [Temnothorax longispinosus]|uniref:Uncharacterized protein n=1 Tax=Temnothorax longispinosus TaxID=300112 RepID=A0A4S2KRL9_9HYME|nr:hypothetical protein DBV15_07947 [Temnothorax longispinosus]
MVSIRSESLALAANSRHVEPRQNRGSGGSGGGAAAGRQADLVLVSPWWWSDGLAVSCGGGDGVAVSWLRWCECARFWEINVARRREEGETAEKPSLPSLPSEARAGEKVKLVKVSQEPPSRPWWRGRCIT